MAESHDASHGFNVMCKLCGAEFRAPGNCPDCGSIFTW